MSNIKNRNIRTREDLRARREYYSNVKPFTDRMRHYSTLIDHSLRKRMTGTPEQWDKTVIEEWLARVKLIDAKMPKIDYDNNILFVCDSKIPRETFFTAFFKLGLLAEYRFLNLLCVQDLWNGICNRNMIPIDIFGVDSFQDIREDVLCTYVSSSMEEVGKAPQIWTTIISSRSVNSGIITKNQDTWIYFQGTAEELRKSKFKLWEQFFEKNGLIIDLNPQDRPNNSNIGTYFSH